MGFIGFINNGGAVAWLLVGMGGLALYMIVERVKTLFVDYKIDGKGFTEHVKSLVLADKIEEAITYCAAHPKAPLAYVVKGVLERADRDEQAIEQIVEVRYAEVMPKLRKGMGMLSMLANVATLMGLLGTVHGLMLSFEAVSFADPSQKQTILTQGIAMYMTDTLLGLAVAIPVMFFYAILHGRQSRIFDDIVESTQKVVDLLESRSYVAFSQDHAYSGEVKAQEKRAGPPPAPKKAA